jgi:hypothetical protein
MDDLPPVAVAPSLKSQGLQPRQESRYRKHTPVTVSTPPLP